MNKKILWGVVALFVLTNLATAYYVYQGSKTPLVAEQNLDAVSNPAPVITDQSIATTTEVATSSDGVFFMDAFRETPKFEDATVGELKINFEKEPIKTDAKEFFSINNSPILEKLGKKEYEEPFIHFYIFKIGVVTNGKFAGSGLYVVELPNDGMGRSYRMRVIATKEKLIVLSKYSEALSGGEFFEFNNRLTIAGFSMPDTIKIPGSKYILKRADFGEGAQFIILSGENLNAVSEGVFTSINKMENLYLSDKGCYYSKLVDGTFIRYELNIPFAQDYYGINISDAGNNAKTEIIWNSGEANINDYDKRGFGRCGGMGTCFSYIKDLKMSQLIKVGTTKDGIVFYELKNKNTVFPGETTSTVKKVWDMYADTSTMQSPDKKTYEEFLKDHPVIYWQDPFGNIAEFTSVKYKPMAECGKPVIYLYPEKDTKVRVQVAPTGGFKITEPAYNNGWEVLAKPNGELYNYNDKTTYPYLFWEGYGLNYIQPKTGFVVKKENVEKFLEEKLAKLGLIKKEYDEFIAFWLPKMQDKNYYFITFVPQEQFNQLAPLNISPKPDTIIRVFMDYAGLDYPVRVQAPEIVTPVRIGFTVVEWGGALHK
jgi:hypothetical protein